MASSTQEIVLVDSLGSFAVTMTVFGVSGGMNSS